MIKRALDIAEVASPGKALILYGPRRTGKTTLLKQYLQTSGKDYTLLNGDNLSDQQALSTPDIHKLDAVIGGFSIIAIDEAQNIPDIGRSLKLIVDEHPELIVIATGSSSFELAGQIGEPLVGRKRSAFLYPLWIKEICDNEQGTSAELAWQQVRDQLLIFGTYPQSYVANNDNERAEFLSDLVDSLLLKDILAYQEVKGSRILHQLLVLLAHQIGSEVSLSELGSQLNINKQTVARYLDLLEKSFVIFRLGGFSRNMRSEVVRTAKYYFYDTGIRNALINNFNSLGFRDDLGKLWENFALVERMKSGAYKRRRAARYFWRTWQKSEIDLIEDANGVLNPYEFKWSLNKRVKTPSEWQKAYPDAQPLEVITPENLTTFAF
jgi:predicted AAA+ superfamily ATPase